MFRRETHPGGCVSICKIERGRQSSGTSTAETARKELFLTAAVCLIAIGPRAHTQTPETLDTAIPRLVDAYPESYNVYDSLGEACLAGGYERSLTSY